MLVDAGLERSVRLVVNKAVWSNPNKLSKRERLKREKLLEVAVPVPDLREGVAVALEEDEAAPGVVPADGVDNKILEKSKKVQKISL